MRLVGGGLSKDPGVTRAVSGSVGDAGAATTVIAERNSAGNIDRWKKVNERIMQLETRIHTS